MLPRGGPEIDLDGPDEDTLVLNRDRKVNWLPLFATREAIHGIMIAKTSRSSNYRRLGRILIPVLKTIRNFTRQKDPNPNHNVKITRYIRSSSNVDRREENEEDWRGQRLIEIMKTTRPVDITLG